ncbi:flagellar export chaperone FliS [Acetivibrio clariflavus]|uniref:Flagellar secretion chaperone FliS n=1 Tax=Acetivibrio clariflavus (strain DSM 19732 / NBRC 101661 / EBR45) TaxID=720554 RepID=G8LSZ5_ACECE|nr:flagellar export chaperone FliS [Acetivibrio clariflavus]AEV70508.1 flagellar biosynthetic protein FliS [Acetivibrio clariflavus DSM 19732]
MAFNNGYEQYRESSVYTATPEELVLMLYNGLVKFLMQAQMAINKKNIEKANNCIIKAQNILTEFRCTLDMKYDIAHQLDSLYDYMLSRLIDANIKKDNTIIEEILGYARELRNTWEQAMKIAKQQNSRTAQVAK